MTDLVRWEPFRELMSLRDAMDRLVEESFVPTLRTSWFGGDLSSVLAVDMYETKDDVVIKATVPGVSPDDLDISVSGDVLTIKGETKEEKKTEEVNYIRQERRFGAFRRDIQLPVAVNLDKAEATFEDGVLTLTLPKAEEVKPKKLTVQAKKK